MIGLAYLILFILLFFILKYSLRLFPSKKSKIILAAAATIGFLAYTAPGYFKHTMLCKDPGRYKVLKTKTVEYINIDNNMGLHCEDGPKILASTKYKGFDCVMQDDSGKTSILRYKKKPGWNVTCDQDCLTSEIINSTEHNYKAVYRQGFVSGNIATITYGIGRVGPITNESYNERLQFTDTVLIDVKTSETDSLEDNIETLKILNSNVADTEMAYSRSYRYYPLGRGLIRIFSGSSGSAPSIVCANPAAELNILDVYLPKP